MLTCLSLEAAASAILILYLWPATIRQQSELYDGSLDPIHYYCYVRVFKNTVLL